MTVDQLKADLNELIKLHQQANADATRALDLATKYAGAAEVLSKMIAREEAKLEDEAKRKDEANTAP